MRLRSCEAWLVSFALAERKHLLLKTHSLLKFQPESETHTQIILKKCWTSWTLLWKSDSTVKSRWVWTNYWHQSSNNGLCDQAIKTIGSSQLVLPSDHGVCYRGRAAATWEAIVCLAMQIEVDTDTDIGRKKVSSTWSEDHLLGRAKWKKNGRRGWDYQLWAGELETKLAAEVGKQTGQLCVLCVNVVLFIGPR